MKILKYTQEIYYSFKKDLIFYGKQFFFYFKENIPARIIGLLWLIMFSSIVPLLFSSDSINEFKIDVYLFLNYKRYPEHIAYDLSEWFNITTLIYCVYLLLPNKKYQDYAKPFLIVSLLGLPAYFLFYSQYITLITIPLILFWQISKIRKYYVKKADNIRTSNSDIFHS